jgi:pilus assembly protein FimV
VAEESTDEDGESCEFSLGDASTAPAAAAETADDEPEEFETFEFDVGSVSSFEEDDNTEADTAEAGDDTETFVFNMNDNDETDDEADPLAAALDEIDPAADESSDDSSEGGNDDINNDVAKEIAADSDDELDLDSIEIDDSLFDSDEVAEGARDEASTKLDLAVAYEAMGDMDGAREILQEVMAEGNDSQKAEAEKLMEKWSLS